MEPTVAIQLSVTEHAQLEVKFTYPLPRAELEAKLLQKKGKISHLKTEAQHSHQQVRAVEQKHQAALKQSQLLDTEKALLQTQIAQLRQHVNEMTEQFEKQGQRYKKLYAAYKSKLNSPAEQLLAQQQTMNKGLLEKNVVLELELQDALKRTKELQLINTKLRESIKAEEENQVFRESQIKKVLMRIKQLDEENIRLKEELNQKNKILTRQKHVPQPGPESPVIQKKLNDALKTLSVKDNEIRMMRDMLKGYKQKEAELQKIKRNQRLPPLVSQSGPQFSQKPLKKRITFKDSAFSSEQSLEPGLVHEHSSGLIRKGTPPPKEFFEPKESPSATPPKYDDEFMYSKTEELAPPQPILHHEVSVKELVQPESPQNINRQQKTYHEPNSEEYSEIHNEKSQTPDQASEESNKKSELSHESNKSFDKNSEENQSFGKQSEEESVDRGGNSGENEGSVDDQPDFHDAPALEKNIEAAQDPKEAPAASDEDSDDSYEGLF